MSLISVSAGRCQFCHRTGSDLAQIIAGDSGFICDQCVQACAALLSAGSDAGAPAAPSGRFAFQRLARHFAPRSAHEMHAKSRTFPVREQADLQQALDELLGERRVPENFVGIHAHYRHEPVGYSKLLESRSSTETAPPQYEEIDIGRGETVRCLKNGLWLLRDEAEPYAIVLSQVENDGQGQRISVEIAAPPGDREDSLHPVPCRSARGPHDLADHGRAGGASSRVHGACAPAATRTCGH